ncbi:hypothetical protein H5410_002727, partial [Solanum commersonii]
MNQIQHSHSKRVTQCMFSPIGLSLFFNQSSVRLTQDHKGLSKACSGDDCKVTFLFTFMDCLETRFPIPSSFLPFGDVSQVHPFTRRSAKCIIFLPNITGSAAHVRIPTMVYIETADM